MPRKIEMFSERRSQVLFKGGGPTFLLPRNREKKEFDI